MRCTAQSASFRSKWWTIGWGVAVVAFALHVAALTLAPISVGQAVLAGGLVFLAVLADRFFGMQLGRRQWIGIGVVAVAEPADADRRRRREERTPATRWRG
jgi:multidrug transporter EmrE-like cation transporter